MHKPSGIFTDFSKTKITSFFRSPAVVGKTGPKPVVMSFVGAYLPQRSRVRPSHGRWKTGHSFVGVVSTAVVLVCLSPHRSDPFLSRQQRGTLSHQAVDGFSTASSSDQ